MLDREPTGASRESGTCMQGDQVRERLDRLRLFSPGGDGANVAGVWSEAESPDKWHKEIDRQGEIFTTLSALPQPPTAWQVSGFGGRAWVAGIFARRGFLTCFHPAFRCAAYGATFGTALRAFGFQVFPCLIALNMHWSWKRNYVPRV